MCEGTLAHAVDVSADTCAAEFHVWQWRVMAAAACGAG